MCDPDMLLNSMRVSRFSLQLHTFQAIVKVRKVSVSSTGICGILLCPMIPRIVSAVWPVAQRSEMNGLICL